MPVLLLHIPIQTHALANIAKSESTRRPGPPKLNFACARRLRGIREPEVAIQC